VVVHDPLYADDELAALGLTAYHLGEPVDAAVVQTDHAEYARLGAADLPGVQVVLDGRRVTSADGWGDATRVVLGEPLP
jgi:UDP-N-acetyl-D-glucosamine dehydrogenase